MENEKLASALERLRELQADGSRVFASAQLSRTARERLVKHGFLLEAMKGWLVSASPTTLPGDTTPWFASFWEFCRKYCDERFGDRWHLSPEQSLLLYAEYSGVPKQVIVYSPLANNNRIDLLFDTSLFAVKETTMPPPRDLIVVDGLRVFQPAAALVRVPAAFFADRNLEAQVVLQNIREPSELLVRLLAGGHSVIAGRLVGAFRRLGAEGIANEIKDAMRAADLDVRETDPFEAEAVVVASGRPASPIVARLRTLWSSARGIVLDELPPPPGLPGDPKRYLQRVDDVYKLDAYHSLSIEGYEVTEALVERVARGSWEPSESASDRATQNALAARGYWLAFQRVRETVKRVVSSDAGPEIVRRAHREWYREMFSPQVAAGLLDPTLLAGYRNQAVFLRGSRHIPPRWEVLGEAMPVLFDLMEQEPEPNVRAVLAHWLVGYVHPFPDGNGRIARFIMNVHLASGGHPWTVIRVDDRADYLAALEAASVAGDVRPFARFIALQIRRSQRRIARSRPRPRRR